MNHSVSSLPLRINPTGRTLSESKVKRTRWSEAAGLAGEGVADSVSTTINSSVWSTIASNAVYGYEVLLDPIGTLYTTLQAEAFSAETGTTNEVCTDTGAGQDVTNISTNDWLHFDNINLGLASTIRLRVARAAGSPESRIEVRQGSITGTVLGSIAVPETGGWQTWETIEASLTATTGTHSLYLKFVENGTATGTALANLNWLQLILPTTPTSLATAPVTTTQIALTWASSPGATSYEISRSTALAGTRYYYKIRAIFTGVASTDSAAVSSVPSNPIVLGDLIIGSATIGSDGVRGQKITLSIAKSGVGQFYQAVSSLDMANASWANASGVFMGNGGLLQIDVPIPAGAPRYFYKVNAWRE